MEFVKGEKVEVCSKEEGFVGSYYAATIKAKLSQDSYRVMYKNLLTEDESQPLLETVSADELRPVPPRPVPTAFRRADMVDAFDNDGWWVGEISGIKENLYAVYFHTTGDELFYPMNRLRRHMDWIDGNWVSSKKRGL